MEYREGTDIPLTVRKLVGLRTYSNLTLKPGYTKNRELWNWYTNIVNGIPDRRNGSIILMEETRNDVLRWSFESGWINKIEGPAFKASGSAVKNPVRRVTQSLWRRRAPQRLIFTITASGFLRGMVRSLVGTMVEIGQGKRPPADLADLLATGNRRLTGPTAPPQGLFLVEVVY